MKFDFSDLAVLIVDDEAALRDMLVEDFELMGAKVYSADNGLAALEVLASERIDLIISDVKMPELDGLELLKRVRAIDPRIPVVILVTGFAECTVERAVELGAMMLFPKPIPRKAFLSYIKEIA